MKSTKQEIDVPTKFWTEWLAADEEKRILMVQKTLIGRELADHYWERYKSAKIKKDYVAFMAAHTVNDYFSELESALLMKNS